MATDKEYRILVKTDLQNEIPMGIWTTDREWANRWVQDWLPDGKDYERFAEDGEHVEYVKILVRDWVRPNWMDNVEEG